jgi:hypothetical protein
MGSVNIVPYLNITFALLQVISFLHPFHFTGAKILIRFAQYAVSANVPVVFC